MCFINSRSSNRRCSIKIKNILRVGSSNIKISLQSFMFLLKIPLQKSDLAYIYDLYK